MAPRSSRMVPARKATLSSIAMAALLICSRVLTAPNSRPTTRDRGTPEENKAVVQGSLGYSGTYSVSDKTLIFNVEASTYPNAEGQEQKRNISSLTADELKYTNPAPTVAGTAQTVLRRVK